ncbi:Cuticle protein AMP1A, partial [Clarias magur]
FFLFFSRPGGEQKAAPRLRPPLMSILCVSRSISVPSSSLVPVRPPSHPHVLRLYPLMRRTESQPHDCVDHPARQPGRLLHHRDMDS